MYNTNRDTKIDIGIPEPTIREDLIPSASIVIITTNSVANNILPCSDCTCLAI